MGNNRCYVNNDLCVPRFGGEIKQGEWIGLGFCSFHWSRAYRNGDRDHLFSMVFGSGKYKRESRRSHYDCSVPECTEKAMPLTGLCPKHHKVAWRYRVSDDDFIKFVINPHCQNPECSETSDLVMDHDHSCCDKPPTCGKCNRGWLCRKCNISIGMAQESPRIIRGLIKYLEDYDTRMQ